MGLCASSSTRSFASSYALENESSNKLGEGAFAKVLLGSRKSDGLQVAVKISEKELMKEEDLRAMMQEIEILQNLDHPAIMKLYDNFEDAKNFYLCTELLEGGELFQRIVETYEDGGQYSERDASTIVRTLVDALEYLHDRGVVHRDLKPENILLVSKSSLTNVKLIDFGFATRLVDNNPNLSTPCGTPGYVAPEIINGVEYGAPVDVWSLGVIAYILLCGYPPFFHQNQPQMFNMIKKGDYEYDPEYWGEISQEAKDCIDCMLTVPVKKRATMSSLKRVKWLQSDLGIISDKQLDKTGAQMKSFLARRRWKKGINGVMATIKMKNLLGSLTAGEANNMEKGAAVGSDQVHIE